MEDKQSFLNVAEQRPERNKLLSGRQHRVEKDSWRRCRLGNRCLADVFKQLLQCGTNRRREINCVAGNFMQKCSDVFSFCGLHSSLNALQAQMERCVSCLSAKPPQERDPRSVWELVR